MQKTVRRFKQIIWIQEAEFNNKFRSLRGKLSGQRKVFFWRLKRIERLHNLKLNKRRFSWEERLLLGFSLLFDFACGLLGLTKSVRAQSAKDLIFCSHQRPGPCKASTDLVLSFQSKMVGGEHEDEDARKPR